MYTHTDSVTQNKSIKSKKRLPWDKRLNLLIFGLVLAAGIKVLINAVVEAPMPPSEFPGIGGNFTLQGATGPVTEDVLLNKVSVIYFGYTHCPDICPNSLNHIATAFRMLHESKDLAKTQALFITLDPERDKVDLMANFANYFHSNIKGLSGSENQIFNVAEKFKIGYEKQNINSETGDYSISHTGYLYIVRPDGKLGELLSHNSTPKKIAEAIQQWLPWVD